jgi:membrane-associated phospholipid phosphatase
MSNKENKILIPGMLLTFLTGACLIAASFIIGRNDFFLLLNDDLGATADFFFRYWTNLGDGFMWVWIAVLFFIYRKNKIPLLVAAILFSTILTQVTKNYLVPAEPRPTVAITGYPIHTVRGVELHTAYSFPSGHTATAFTIFLLACILLNKRWVLAVGFTYALLVAYSRVYLAQHFPLDLGGGMIAAVFAVLLSILVQRSWEKRSTN